MGLTAKLNKLISCGSLVALAACSPSLQSDLRITRAQPDPTDERFTPVAMLMAARTDARCDSQFDGDASKGEITNADMKAVFNAPHVGHLYKGVTANDIGERFVALANQGWTVCVDRRLNEQKLGGQYPVTAVLHMAVPDNHDLKPMWVIAIPSKPQHPQAIWHSTQAAIASAVGHLMGKVPELINGLIEQTQEQAQSGVTSPVTVMDLVTQPYSISTSPTNFDQSAFIALDRKVPKSPARPVSAPQKLKLESSGVMI